jgi:hypothetical protein
MEEEKEEGYMMQDTGCRIEIEKASILQRP